MNNPTIQNNISIKGVGDVVSFPSESHIDLGFEMTILGVDYVATSIHYSERFVRNITLENKDEVSKRYGAGVFND